MHMHRRWFLGVFLAACGGAADEGEASSGGAASSSGGVPTSGGEATTTSGGTSTSGGESTTSGTTGEPPPPALPPLAAPVVLTDEALRVPVHARDEERVLDMRVPADLEEALAQGYGAITLAAGEPVLARTLDGSEPPAPGPGAKLLVRLVHLADVQLSDDESPSRLVNFDEVSSGAFRPEEAHFCRMLNAAARTINRLHVDRPIDFVLLGGDNIDNAQGNELEWFLGILDGAPAVECDSAIDDDPVPGPDNDPKDRFAPVGLDVPWRWVSGNHDILRQGNWPPEAWASEPIGTSPVGGTRDWSVAGGPITTEQVPADPARAFLVEAESLERVAAAGDGHGITAEALALGEAYYTFDVAGTPLRFFVVNTAAATGAAKGLIRQVDVDAIIEPILQQAAVDEKVVIMASHHRADSLANGFEIGVGMAFDDALLADDWISYVGTHPHVLLHLAAHSHTMRVQPRTPLGGHSYWEMAAPALADFPSQMRLVEVHDMDNGFYAIRSIAFDFVAEDDPVADEGRTQAVADFTSAWSGDGRGPEPEDRNVELWIAKP